MCYMNMLMLIFLYVVWGTTYTAIVFALEGFEPFTLAGWRFFIAGLIFTPFTRLHNWRIKNCWPHIIGGIGLSTANALVVWSQTAMPSGLAALFVGSVPLWLIALDWIFFSKNRPHHLSLIGCVIGLIGLYLLSAQTGQDLTLRLSAFVLIGAALLWSIGTLVLRNGPAHLNRRSAMAVQLVSGGLFQFVLALIMGEGIIPGAQAFEFKAFSAWVYLVLFGSVLAMMVYNYLLGILAPAVIGTYALANPIVAMLLGFWLFNEQVSSATLISGGLVLVGVAFILLSGRVRPLVPTVKALKETD